MSTTSAPKQEEVTIRLPAEAMFTAFFAVVFLIVVCWCVLAVVGWQPWSVVGAGLLGALAAVVVGGGGLLILKPWNPRRAGDLAMLWLASTVVRVLLTPLLALLLYSAAHPPIYPFVLGAGTAYLAILFSETALVSRHLRLQFDKVEGPSVSR